MTSETLRIRGLDHLLLIVDNMSAAVGFYRDVLGCTLKASLPEYGMAELAAGAQGLDLVDAAAPEGAWARSATPGRNLDHFCLAVDVADEGALRDHLAANAAEIVEERAEAGFSSLYVRDPCGNVVELKFPTPGAG